MKVSMYCHSMFTKSDLFIKYSHWVRRLWYETTNVQTVSELAPNHKQATMSGSADKESCEDGHQGC